MGRERQKFKNRSSVSKVKTKPKSKKKILHNPIIAANWNQKETLTQNYRRLGLASKLNATSGGDEKTGSSIPHPHTSDSQQPPPTDPLKITSKLPTKLDVSEVKIRRDPSTGAILQVYDSDRRANPLRDLLNDIDSGSDDDEGWTGIAGVESHTIPHKQRAGGADTAVVRTLEAEAGRVGEKKPRQQSEREAEWVGRLVDKYGDDFGKMARDAKLNPMQQSVGDIRKRVGKWRAAREVGE